MNEGEKSLTEALRERGYTHRKAQYLRHCGKRGTQALCHRHPRGPRKCACRCADCSVLVTSSSARHQIYDSNDNLIATLTAKEGWEFIKEIDNGQVRRGDKYGR